MNIYIIKNEIDDRVYIGSTCKDIQQRWLKHVSNHNTKDKRHYKLYTHMRELGVNNFSIELLDVCDVCDRYMVEDAYILDYWDRCLNMKLNCAKCT